MGIERVSLRISLLCIPLLCASAACSTGMRTERAARTGQPRGVVDARHAGNQSNDTEVKRITTVPTQPIAEYVVEIHEDQNGHLWFGTMTRGAARYDGKSLTYITQENGLAGNTVSSMTEDKQGNIWFGTHSGITRFDGREYKSFTMRDGLVNDRVTCIVPDKDGTFWIATFNGVSRFDGKTFETFELPIPESSQGPQVSGPFQLPGQQWVRDILIDRKGHVWFSRDGYGACRYDGKGFTHFTKSDGLASNSVFSLEEDVHGNIWFACVQHAPWYANPDKSKSPGDNGGACIYDGKKIRCVEDIEFAKGDNVFTLYNDQKGSVWISNIGRGVFRHESDGKGSRKTVNFLKTNNPETPKIPPVQSMLRDRRGDYWFGCSGGLFRLIDKTFVEVTSDGPWPTFGQKDE